MNKQEALKMLTGFDGHTIIEASLAREIGNAFNLDISPIILNHKKMVSVIEARGKGGYLNGEGDCVAIHQLSEFIADKLLNYIPQCVGIGSAHRECCQHITA